jgi:hypothetical protein
MPKDRYTPDEERKVLAILQHRALANDLKAELLKAHSACGLYNKLRRAGRRRGGEE